eukprot:1969858-Amphidinium_carterae.1
MCSGFFHHAVVQQPCKGHCLGRSKLTVLDLVQSCAVFFKSCRDEPSRGLVDVSARRWSASVVAAIQPSSLAGGRWAR